MSVITIDQNHAVAEHLKWCQQIISENEAEIALFETTNLKAGTTTDGEWKDITAARINRLKEHNAILQRFVDRLTPPEFPKEVRATMRASSER